MDATLIKMKLKNSDEANYRLIYSKLRQGEKVPADAAENCSVCVFLF